MDFLKASFHRIRAFFAIPVRHKFFIIISAAVVVLAAVLFVVYPQTPPPAFVGFNEVERAHETLESAVNGSDRLVKLTILREIPLEECASIPGMFATVDDVPKDKDGHRPLYIDGYVYATLSSLFNNGRQFATLFDAVITYDYDTDKKVSEKIVIPYFGSHQYQDEGNPIYYPGEQFVMMLEKLWSPEGPLYAVWATFDVLDTENGEFLLKRYNAYDEIQGLLMSDSDRTRVTSTKENPVKNQQKFKVEDFVAAVKQKRAEIKNNSPSASEPAGTQ